MRALQFLIGILLISASPSDAGPLGEAAKKGDVAEIERLLASGVDANDSDGLASPLHWAAMNGHADAVILLVSEGARTDAQSSMLGTPLHAAARMNRADVVTTLIGNGADIEALNNKKLSPLHVAVMEDQVEAVRALIEAGADVNAVGIPAGGDPAHGETSSLHLALRLEHAQVAKLLIAAGAVPRSIEEVDITLGDPVRGREIARSHCGECHALEAGDNAPMQNAAGPPLIGVANRPVADFTAFGYSDALKRFGGDWTANRLYTFVRYPMLTVPGTKMFWTKPTNQQERIDLTSYLMTKD